MVSKRNPISDSEPWAIFFKDGSRVLDVGFNNFLGGLEFRARFRV